jgi:peptidyl-prolyl cis-trans isomerase D
MGTFENIRKISPYFFGAVAVLLVAFFTIGDYTVVEGIRGSAQAQGEVIGTINGEEISYTDYEEIVRQTIEAERQQMLQAGREPEVDGTRIRKQIWDQKINELMMQQLMNTTGIEISDEIVAEQMIENPPQNLKQSFTDSAGNFMRDVYVELLTNPESYINYAFQDPSQATVEERERVVNQFRSELISIQEWVRNTQRQNSLVSLVNAAGTVLSPTYLRNRYIQENATVDVKFIPVLARDIKLTQTEISDEEVKKYYEENKSFFKQEKAMRFKYVSLRVKPSADDSSRAKERVKRVTEAINEAQGKMERNKAFDLMLSQYSGDTYEYQNVTQIDPQNIDLVTNMEIGEVVGPVNRGGATKFFRLDDRRDGNNANMVVKASHILIRTNNNKDSARAEAQKILNRVKSGGDFAALAMEYSEDPTSGRRGGDLGFFGKGQMVKPFEEAAFAMEAGEISGLVESQFGYHIIKVDDKKSEELKYSEITIEPKITTITKQQIFREGKSIASQLENGANIDTLASQLGLNVRESPKFTQGQSVLGSNTLAGRIFDAEVGDVIGPEEMENYGVVIMQVTDEIKPGFKALAEVDMEIRRKITNIKKLDLAKIEIDKVYQQAKNFTDLDALAGSNSQFASQIQSSVGINPSEQIPGVGFDRVFSAALLNLPVGKISQPIRGELGYYIIEVVNRQVPGDEEIASSMKDFRNTVLQGVKGSAFFEWFEEQKQEAKIDDERYKRYGL